MTRIVLRLVEESSARNEVTQCFPSPRGGEAMRDFARLRPAAKETSQLLHIGRILPLPPPKKKSSKK